MRYKKILIKISGEFFEGNGALVDFEKVKKIANEIKALKVKGVEVAVVTGSGNIFRGRERKIWFPEVVAHQIGTLTTFVNALALKGALDALKVKSRVFGAFGVGPVVQPFQQEEVLSALDKKEVVIFAGGTGHPFFTTDTGAILRALEIGAEVVLKATKVDGVYDKDPVKFRGAKKYKEVGFDEAISKKLGIMDSTALSLARENNLEIRVFKFKEGAMARILMGDEIGSTIK